MDYMELVNRFKKSAFFKFLTEDEQNSLIKKLNSGDRKTASAIADLLDKDRDYAVFAHKVALLKGIQISLSIFKHGKKKK